MKAEEDEQEERDQERLILEGIHPNHLRKCIEIALQNRNFEIGLLWQRALLFWGFVSVLLIAVAELRTASPHLAIVFSLMGVLFSFIWALVNRASKSWQESWEIKVNAYARVAYNTSYLFTRAVHFPERASILGLTPTRYSVSKLLIALSYYALVFWLCLSAYLMVKHVNFYSLILFKWQDSPYLAKDLAVVGFALLIMVGAAIVHCDCRSGDQSILEKAPKNSK